MGAFRFRSAVQPILAQVTANEHFKLCSEGNCRVGYRTGLFAEATNGTRG